MGSNADESSYTDFAVLLSELEKRVYQRFDQNDKALAAALLAAKEAVTAALTAAKEAVDKAERAADKRFESVNEFRAQLADQASTFISRELADSQFDELRKQMTSVTARVDTAAGRDQGSNIEHRLQGASRPNSTEIPVISRRVSGNRRAFLQRSAGR